MVMEHGESNKAGFAHEVKAKTESRPKDVPHGDTEMAVANACPQLTVLRWWDRKPSSFSPRAAVESLRRVVSMLSWLGCAI